MFLSEFQAASWLAMKTHRTTAGDRYVFQSVVFDHSPSNHRFGFQCPKYQAVHQ